LSRQIIDIGKTPNDGTGDPIRTAMIKVNENFAEVYGSWTVTGPLIIASDTSNTTITDKKIAVNRVEIPGNVVISTTGLNVNGSNYISSNGIVGSSLAVGQYVRTDGISFVVNNFFGTNTTITGNSVTACTFAVPNSFVIDSTGIKSGNITLITPNTVVTANVTVGNVKINQNGINVNGAIVGVGYMQTPSLTAQDIVANSTIRVGGVTTITPVAIQTNGLGIGNVAVTVDNITVGGSTPAGGTVVGPSGVSTAALVVNGAITAGSIRAKVLNVDEGVIDKITADSLEIGQYSKIDGTSVSSQNGAFTALSSYNSTVNNSLIVGGANGVYVSSFEITTPSLSSKGKVTANSLFVNTAITANEAFFGGITSITNTGISTSDVNITNSFQAPNIKARDSIDVGGGRVVATSAGLINADTISLTGKIEIAGSVGNAELYTISMSSDGSFRTGDNLLNFFKLDMANGVIISQNAVAIANSLILSNTDMGTITVGNTLVNATSIIADRITSNALFKAQNIFVGNAVDNTNINATSIETNLVISNNMSVTNAVIGGVSLKASGLTVGAARVDANTISITGGAVINTTGVIVTANLVPKAIIANNAIGTPGQALYSNGTGVYWGPAGGADPNALQKAQNLADLTNPATARTNLGVPGLTGSGATGTWTININGNATTVGNRTPGVGADNLVYLDNAARLPAVDGSQLLNVKAATATDATTVSGKSVGTSANQLIPLDTNAKIPASADKIIISTNDPDPAQGAQNWLWIKV
jgi:hypothetical protein